MLLNDFFHIDNLEVAGFDIKATLTINPAHRIFDGHFPGQPVVPGVCMMQMLKEIIEKVTGKDCNLSKAQDMKFLAVIDPQQNNVVEAAIKYADQPGGIMVTASLFKADTMHFKFKGQFDFL